MIIHTKKNNNNKKKSQKDNEPKKTPIHIPSNRKVLENVKSKRKITRLLERQAIMYGIDCLDETLAIQAKTDESTENPGRRITSEEDFEGVNKRKNLE